LSKISEYQAALEKLAKARELQSVSDFAKELKKSSETLLSQLAEAGISKSSASDPISSIEKNKLLEWFQVQHGDVRPRKKITVVVDPIERRLIRDVAEHKNGAEYEALEYLLGAVIRGEKVPSSLQKLINIIVAKCLFFGALPLRKLGRPKQEALDVVGLNAAEKYWELVDSGVSYQEAVETVSSEIHKSERHVMRLVAKHKKKIGETKEAREAYRSYWNFHRTHFAHKAAYRDAMARYLRAFEPAIPPPELSEDDYLEHLDELVERLASQAKPLTKKI
jgi:hypothetical protein